MNNTSLKKLSESVNITPYYQRSVLLSEDLSQSKAVDGYVFQETSRNLLSSMAQQITNTQQGAFTWTGPFGSGKSSLALVLSAALSSNANEKKRAREVLHATQIKGFDDAFPSSEKGWLVVPVVGSRASFIESIAKALSTALKIKCKSKDDILNTLATASSTPKAHDGVLLIIDEMGKFLEGTQESGDDVYFFQELAELCSRSKGKLLTIAIMHQSFQQYGKAQGLSEATQNEWAKVHGRFSDIPLISSTDEVIDLLGHAISSNITLPPETQDKVFGTIYESVSSRKQGIPPDLPEKLSKCWPLHPTTALLIGPASKRPFSQNERSIFTFLSSSEPFGFQDFLKNQNISNSQGYTPANYWDYLESNLEPAILSSIDGHKWSIANTAIEKAESLGLPLHSSITKSIAVIDLFKNGSGLAVDKLVLASLFPLHKEKEIFAAISDLEKWKIIVFRKFNNAWSIFEGSDFDIEKALDEEKRHITFIDTKKLSDFAKLSPIVAKKHLYETGALRWMGVTITQQESLDELIKSTKSSSSEFGKFILVLDKKHSLNALSKKLDRSAPILVFGHPQNAKIIDEYTKELLAYQAVSNRPELEGDAVARKEVISRLSSIKTLLEQELSHSLKDIEWIVSSSNKKVKTNNLSRLASDLADELFKYSPQVHSELLNRDTISSNSVRARKDLIYKMLSHSKMKDLGLEGYPAEKGLYLTTLKHTGLHCFDSTSSEYKLCKPSQDDKRLSLLWNSTDEYISSNSDSVKASDIYNLWRQPPFGMKEGLIPVFFWAYIFSNSGRFALYRDGIYRPEIEEIDIDYSLQNIHRFDIKGIELTDKRLNILKTVAKALNKSNVSTQKTDALTSARLLVSLVYKLEPWVKKTRSLSSESLKLRDILLRASDPHKVIFHDLAIVFKTDDASTLENKLISVIDELTSAYQTMLHSFKDTLLEQLSATSERQIQSRAQNIKGTAGDFLIEAFITRLTGYDGSNNGIAEVLSLVSEKPISDWIDQDPLKAQNALVNLSRKFRELETIAEVNSRNSTRQAIALVYGTSGKDFIKHIEIDECHSNELDSITSLLLQNLKAQNLPSDMQFAAIAKALEQLNRENA